MWQCHSHVLWPVCNFIHRVEAEPFLFFSVFASGAGFHHLYLMIRCSHWPRIDRALSRAAGKALKVLNLSCPSVVWLFCLPESFGRKRRKRRKRRKGVKAWGCCLCVPDRCCERGCMFTESRLLRSGSALIPDSIPEWSLLGFFLTELIIANVVVCTWVMYHISCNSGLSIDR